MERIKVLGSAGLFPGRNESTAIQIHFCKNVQVMGKEKRWTEADILRKGYSPDGTGAFMKNGTNLFKAACPPLDKSYENSVNKLISQPLQQDHVEFIITPIGKPRMTKRDQWKTDPGHPDPKMRQRKPVTLYYKFKDELILQAARAQFVLPDSCYHCICVIPMPQSWSTKKKNQLRNAPHQQKPDKDNIEKALLDCLRPGDDHNVWDGRVTKYWGDSGKIIIKKIPPP